MFPDIVNIGCDIELFVCPKDKIHPFNGGCLLLSQLGITAHYSYEGVRIAVDELPYRLPAFAVSSISDGACVDNIYVSMTVGRHSLEPLLGKGTGNGGSFGKIKLASQCVKRYFSLQDNSVTVPAVKIVKKAGLKQSACQFSQEASFPLNQVHMCEQIKSFHLV